MQFKLSKYHVALEIPHEGEPSASDYVLFATRSGATAKVDAATYDAIKTQSFDGLSDLVLVRLCAIELLVPSEEDEFETILSRNKHGTAQARTLDVTIQPTANCQLGCTYCGQQHKPVKAGTSLQAKIIRRILANLDAGHYTGLSIQWFGAEPLMAFSTIRRMSQTLIAACQERGVSYHAQMITNGLSFKPGVFSSLLSCGVVEYQITLDGIAKTHDAQRMTKLGRGTFDTILQNVVAVTTTEEYQNSKCFIVLRTNVNRASSTEISSLIRQLADLGLYEKRVYLDFQPVVNWGDNEAAQTSFSPEIYAEMEIEWIIEALDQGFKFGQFLPSRRFSPCMVVHEDGEVYDAEGNIYPCYEFPYTPVFEGDNYKIGHIDSVDTDRNANAVTKRWFDDLRGNVSPCKFCNLYPVCGGGCPKKWLHGDRACPSFKDNIEDRLALHYLQKVTHSSVETIRG